MELPSESNCSLLPSLVCCCLLLTYHCLIRCCCLLHLPSLLSTKLVSASLQWLSPALLCTPMALLCTPIAVSCTPMALLCTPITVSCTPMALLCTPIAVSLHLPAHKWHSPALHWLVSLTLCGLQMTVKLPQINLAVAPQFCSTEFPKCPTGELLVLWEHLCRFGLSLQLPRFESMKVRRCILSWMPARQCGRGRCDRASVTEAVW